MSGELRSVEVFAMCVNTSLGAGFLAIPWVFLEIGVVAGIVSVLIFYYIATISAVNLVEAIA
jgi:amino acid permease